MIWGGGMDRRRFPRANYPCVVTVRRKGSAEAFRTKTENIGSGGICVILPKEIEMFSLVEIELTLENGEQSIKCDGTVVWVVRRATIGKEVSDLFDTGIEFIDIIEKDRTRIENIVKECTQKDES